MILQDMSPSKINQLLGNLAVAWAVDLHAKAYYLRR